MKQLRKISFQLETQPKDAKTSEERSSTLLLREFHLYLEITGNWTKPMHVNHASWNDAEISPLDTYARFPISLKLLWMLFGF